METGSQPKISKNIYERTGKTIIFCFLRVGWLALQGFQAALGKASVAGKSLTVRR